jgi:hypothetical protein
MSKSDLPPVPPANQTTKGPGDQSKPALDTAGKLDSRERNLAKQGRQGNSKVNTTHQGYQQDR